MLRRKLIARLGVLVVGFVAGAVVAIVLLQDVLRDLDRSSAEGAAAIEAVHRASGLISGLQTDLAAAAPAARAPLAAERIREIRAILADLAGQSAVTGGAARPVYEKVMKLADALGTQPERIGALSVEIGELGHIARQRAATQQAGISRRLRGLIIGLTVAALVMANVTVIVLLHTGRMILKPVGELVEGSRMLARERFDHRVLVEDDDEFGELAHAYNRLAEQLQANEQRKVEMLQQLAVTLNHELNNALSIIEYQVGLLDRRAAGDEALAAHLLRIRENLGRMAATVSSLKNVRRIVLTDYLPGQKMLDLPLSTRPDGATTTVPPDGASGHAA